MNTRTSRKTRARSRVTGTARRRAVRRTRIPSPANPRKILVPVDFSPQSASAIKYASQLVEGHNGEIVLLHVVELIHYVHDFGYGPVSRQRTNDPAIKSASARLRALGRRHLGSGQTWTAEVRSGLACEEIAKAAREMKSEMIVMPTRGLLPAGQVHARNMVARVIHHTLCLVLALRHPLLGRNRTLQESP